MSIQALSRMKILAEAGLSENPFSLVSLLGLPLAFVVVGLLSYFLLQRFAELLIGRTATSIKELLFFTVVVALLCTILVWLNWLSL